MKYTKLDLCLHGTEYAEFKSEVEALSAVTKTMELRASELSLFHYADRAPIGESSCLLNLSPMARDLALTLDMSKYISSIPGEVSPEELDEIGSTTALCCVTPSSDFFEVTQDGVAHLARVVGDGGTLLLDRNTLGRNLSLADCCLARRPLTLIYREEAASELGCVPVRKVIAVGSGRYRLLPQTLLTDIVEMLDSFGMGGAEVVNWEINQHITQILLKFDSIGEDFAKTYGVTGIVPGLLLRTSDTCDSSLCAHGVWITKSGYVIAETVAMKHSNHSDPRKMVEEVKSSIFDLYRFTPEALEQLAKEPVTNPMAELDEMLNKFVLPVTNKGFVANLSAYMEPEIISAKTRKDIVMDLMDVPSRIRGICEETREKIKKALGRLPIEVAKTKKKVAKVEEDDDFFVLPL